MNLLEIRTKLIDSSGRFDLVVDVTDYADQGADFHINAGQKYLDRKAQFKKQDARSFTMVAQGSYYALFQRCRVIERVWCGDTDSRLELIKVDMNKLRGTDYASQTDAFVKPFSDIDQSRPAYYAPSNLKTSPPQNAAGFDLIDGYGIYMDVMLGEDASYNGIVFLPPTDKDYMIEIEGKFLSMELLNNADESSWSINEPDILIMAAMRSIEIHNRNTEGRNDWTAAITEALFDIEKDLVDEESFTNTIMEG